ncbi:MAG TPA: histidine triad nucleotide-binding protein [Polyangiaceae bacterium]
MSCLFCKIAAREIPATIVAENEHALAFRDVRPAAPTHMLVIPKKHITSIASVEDGDALLLGQLMLLARDVAKMDGLDATGYRLVTNNGENAGQSVFHVHVHVLGGRAMAWPPG